MTKLITTKELMDYLQVKDRTTVWKLRKSGLPCIKLGTAVRFDIDKVKEWMESRGKENV